MADNFDEKDTQPSAFREQILRDLEKLKQERLAQNITDESSESVDDLMKRFEFDQIDMIAPQSEENYTSEVSSEIEEIPSGSTVDKSPTSEAEELISQETVELPVHSETVESEAEPVDLTATVVHHFSLKNYEAASADDEVDLSQTIVTSDSKKEPSTSRKQARSRTSMKKHRKKQEKTATRIVMTVIVIVLLALGITGFAGYSYVKSSLEPMNAEATEIVQVEIPQGSTTLEIGKILEKNQLIKNATIFNYYAKLKSYNNFQSGYYNLSQTMSVDDLAKALQEAGTTSPQKPIAGKILIVEGSTIKQIATAVTDNVNTEKTGDKTKFTSDEFLKVVSDQDFINRMVATYPSLFASLPSADSGVVYQLEGYLFPATYEYTDSTTMEELVEQMIAAMDSRLQSYYDQLEGKGLDVNSLLTLASLVEKEGSTDEDRRNIASVFYNRLNAGMALQSNIAILYAMGKLGETTTLAEDAAINTSIESPYNIYINTGLMPGPVDSPSLAAIEATLNPNTTNYYYFVADVKTGTVYYSETLEEHNQNVEKYVNSQISN